MGCREVSRRLYGVGWRNHAVERCDRRRCHGGLPYVALYKSTKLAYAAAAGTALSQIKRVNYVGLIMGRVHNDGIEVGRDFINMDRLPRLYQGRPVTADEMFEDYEEPATAFPGEWKPDSRLCIRATAPKPCVLNAAVVTVETNDKV
ncbi:hypothetical protein AJ88_03845 [Mesorhizobium amorphae CCBAU 01583]|nr:hypothetical protein AJ88_03845 [Mesorhizobium amorphae CCBAU 01583]